MALILITNEENPSGLLKRQVKKGLIRKAFHVTNLAKATLSKALVLARSGRGRHVINTIQSFPGL